jgi:hypothetical protein
MMGSRGCRLIEARFSQVGGGGACHFEALDGRNSLQCLKAKSQAVSNTSNCLWHVDRRNRLLHQILTSEQILGIIYLNS